MAGKSETSSLVPGQSVARDNGERIGCSTGGRRVLMRRRTTTPGFVVTVDARADPEVPAETITSHWEVATAAFDRMMKHY